MWELSPLLCISAKDTAQITFLSLAFQPSHVNCLFPLFLFFPLPLYHILILSFPPCLPPPLSSSLYPLNPVFIQTLTQTLCTLSALFAGIRKWLRPWDLDEAPCPRDGTVQTVASPAKPPQASSGCLSLCVCRCEKEDCSTEKDPQLQTAQGLKWQSHPREAAFI